MPSGTCWPSSRAALPGSWWRAWRRPQGAELRGVLHGPAARHAGRRRSLPPAARRARGLVRQAPPRQRQALYLSLPMGTQSEEDFDMKRIVVLLAGLAGLAERIGTALQWLSPAVARLTVGLVFLQSGWGKLHDLEKVTNYFTQLGLAAPAFQARLASTAEFVCGVLLLIGFATQIGRAH